MWMMQIMADESDAAPMPRDSLFAFLAAHGIPPEVMRSGLDQLRRSKSLRLCKLAAEGEWEIGEGLEPVRLKGNDRGLQGRRHNLTPFGAKVSRV